MRRGGSAATAMVAALVAACGIDFVDVGRPEDTQLVVSLEAMDTVAPTLRVSGQLVPGRGDTEEALIADSTLLVADVALHALRRPPSGATGLVWVDTLPLTGSRLEVIRIVPPDVRGQLRPPALRAALRRDATGKEEIAWRPGTDLVLVLTPPPDADAPSQVFWRLDVQGYGRGGPIFAEMGANTSVPDTLRVAAGLLQGLGSSVDSLRAALRIEATYLSATADSAYQASVRLRQSLGWRVRLTTSP